MVSLCIMEWLVTPHVHHFHMTPRVSTIVRIACRGYNTQMIQGCYSGQGYPKGKGPEIYLMSINMLHDAG